MNRKTTSRRFGSPWIKSGTSDQGISEKPASESGRRVKVTSKSKSSRSAVKSRLSHLKLGTEAKRNWKDPTVASASYAIDNEVDIKKMLDDLALDVSNEINKSKKQVKQRYLNVVYAVASGRVDPQDKSPEIEAIRHTFMGTDELRLRLARGILERMSATQVKSLDASDWVAIQTILDQDELDKSAVDQSEVDFKTIQELSVWCRQSLGLPPGRPNARAPDRPPRAEDSESLFNKSSESLDNKSSESLEFPATAPLEATSPKWSLQELDSHLELIGNMVREPVVAGSEVLVSDRIINLMRCAAGKPTCLVGVFPEVEQLKAIPEQSRWDFVAGLYEKFSYALTSKQEDVCRSTYGLGGSLTSAQHVVEKGWIEDDGSQLTIAEAQKILLKRFAAWTSTELQRYLASDLQREKN